MDRELLLKILRKSGGTDYFTKLVGCLHDGMTVGTRIGEGIYLNRSRYHGGEAEVHSRTCTVQYIRTIYNTPACHNYCFGKS